VQLISAFATFAAAFLVRPLGGFFFGPLSDRMGGKRVLATTIIMMAVGTFGIGLPAGRSWRPGRPADHWPRVLARGGQRG
jgi:MHS family proline/betaine transporter-like MFS transporter